MHGTNDENNDDEEEYEPGTHTQGSPQTTHMHATKVWPETATEIHSSNDLSGCITAVVTISKRHNKPGIAD